MAGRKQIYTVKRIPGKKPSDTRWEILGPGAPEKSMASEVFAHQVRGYLEDAAEALETATRAAVLAEVDLVATSLADPSQDLIAAAPTEKNAHWTVYGLHDNEDGSVGDTFTAAFLGTRPEEGDRA